MAFGFSALVGAVTAASGPFDVETATRAYLDTLQGAARAKSDAYFEGGYWLTLWSALIAVASYWAMLRFGWSTAWSRWAGNVTRHRWLQPALYALPFTLVGMLITLPWSIYTGFIREKQYGLMNQSFPAWAGEQGTALGVGLVTGAIFIAVVFAVIRGSPRRWWLWASGATIVLLTVMIMIAPVFLAPLFNKYTPMAAGPMRDQILTMAHAQGIPANNVYVFDASKQSKRVSANVSGLGPTIRISLNDNLLNRSTPAGVKAVMGHEMGHYVLNHVPKTLLWISAFALLTFLMLYWASPRLLARYGERWRVRTVDDPAVTPLFYLLIAVLSLLLHPATNAMVRTYESEADAFGLEAAREPDGFAQTAMQLSEYRKIEPSPIEAMVFFDHPSGRTRVHMAMAWKAQHLAELPPGQRGIVRPPPMAANR